MPRVSSKSLLFLVVFVAVFIDERPLVQDSIQIFPGEDQADDIIPALDDILMIVDRQQVATTERQEHFQDVTVIRAEAESRAIGQLAADAKMEFADLIG